MRGDWKCLPLMFILLFFLSNNNNISTYNQPPPQNNRKIAQEKTSNEMKEVLEKELNVISEDIVDMMKKKHKIEMKKRGIERTFE